MTYHPHDTLELPSAFNAGGVCRVMADGVELWFTMIDRDNYATGRDAERAAVARLVASRFGDGSLLDHMASGAPFVGGFEGSVSISHGGGVAVMAVADASVGPIGIDVETPRQQLARVAPKFLAPSEMDARGADLGLLLMAWTSKEAVYKAALTPGLPLHDIHLMSDVEARVGDTAYSLSHMRLATPLEPLVTLARESGKSSCKPLDKP